MITFISTMSFNFPFNFLTIGLSYLLPFAALENFYVRLILIHVY